MGSTDDIAFSIDLTTLKASAMPEITLASVGWKERADLQRWIIEHPEIVGPDLLVVTSEFHLWEIKEQKVDDRLDILFLDKKGSLIVAELKRDKAGDTTELQALKYAAYCSKFTVDQLVEEYAHFKKIGEGEARAALLDHAPVLAENGLGEVRIQLVAGSFGPAVTSVVLWLREHKIEIGCIQVTARQKDGSQNAILSVHQLIPLPEAEDYLVRVRRKEQEEEELKERQRRSLTSVALLAKAGVVKTEDVLTLKIDQFAKAVQPKIAQLLADDPEIGRAIWTGEPANKALQWGHDGERYSPTGLVSAILALVGIETTAIPGPEYWLLPTGNSMYEESKLIEQAGSGDSVPPATLA